MTSDNPYKRLAERLDALPSGFPPTEDGAELKLLAKLFTPEEAALAAELRLTLETPEQIAARLAEAGLPPIEPEALGAQLKGMSRKGLIAAGRSEAGLGFGLMPFVVGIYEAQAGRVDSELARLFENYYLQAFGQMLTTQPSFHRVVPIGESIQVGIDVRPFESASEIVNAAQAWGVLDCICRLQKALIGEACEHPVDICMVLSKRPGVFDHHPVIQPLTKEGALETLQRAAKAGLVHSVSNTQEDISYICNCCTCSCGILRGIADLGIANAIARSSFVNQVDEELCIGCEECIETCQFEALYMEGSVAKVNRVRCLGCGVCVQACTELALSLAQRPAEEVLPIPAREADWRLQRAAYRNVDINQIL
jgi:Fe-S-cluster-containing hydrogenase component 2